MTAESLPTVQKPCDAGLESEFPPWPAAPGQTRLLSSINSDAEQLTSLQLFCAAYMQTAVKRGFMTQADRWGFTILAEPLGSQGGEFQTCTCSVLNEYKQTHCLMRACLRCWSEIKWNCNSVCLHNMQIKRHGENFELRSIRRYLG